MTRCLWSLQREVTAWHAVRAKFPQCILINLVQNLMKIHHTVGWPHFKTFTRELLPISYIYRQRASMISSPFHISTSLYFGFCLHMSQGSSGKQVCACVCVFVSFDWKSLGEVEQVKKVKNESRRVAVPKSVLMLFLGKIYCKMYNR